MKENVISPCVFKPKKVFKAKDTPLGDKVILRPHLYYDEKGHKCAEPGEKFDLDGFIQAQAASTDLAAIIARFEAGDIDAINVHQNGFTGDATILPKDIQDVAAYNKIYKEAAENFGKLPAEIQALFANDSANFFNSVMTGKVNDIMKSYEDSKKQAEAPQKENE